MSEPIKLPPKEVVKHWLSELQNPSVNRKLNDWEVRFISSIDWQIDRKGYLSEKQIETLEKIYAEKTS